MHTRV